MSIFAKLTNDGLEESGDRLGGGFAVFDTDIYEATIKLMYAQPAASGALGIVMVFDLPGGKEYRETVYVTNKKGQNWFVNKDDVTKKVPLPGFTTVDDICLITCGKPLAEMQDEEKVINVWDKDLKKEVPKTVPMLTEALGQKVAIGILKLLENKSEKVNEEYVATAETRETNTIDKVFHPEQKITVAEARNGQEAKFWDAWRDRNKGQVRDKRSIKDGAAAGAPANGAPPKPAGAAPQAGGAPTARKSLFAK